MRESLLKKLSLAFNAKVSITDNIDDSSFSTAITIMGKGKSFQGIGSDPLHLHEAENKAYADLKNKIQQKLADESNITVAEQKNLQYVLDKLEGVL